MSCASVRGDVRWKFGVFINTNKRFIIKRLEEDESFSTVLNIPLEGLYEATVGGVERKQIEILTDAGSFEFRLFGGDEGIYKIAEVLQEICDAAREAKREAEFPAIGMITCQYCGARNKLDVTFCVNCGALLK